MVSGPWAGQAPQDVVGYACCSPRGSAGRQLNPTKHRPVDITQPLSEGLIWLRFRLPQSFLYSLRDPLTLEKKLKQELETAYAAYKVAFQEYQRLSEIAGSGTQARGRG